MKKFRRLLRQSEFHGFIFCFSLASLSWPLLGVFHLRSPAIVVAYLFIIWSLLIVMLLFISRGCRAAAYKQKEDHR
jgi:hypothetical protein